MKHTQEEMDKYKDKQYIVPTDISPEDTMYYIVTGLEKDKAELLEACKQALLKEQVMPKAWQSKDIIKTLEQAIAKAEGRE